LIRSQVLYPAELRARMTFISRLQTISLQDAYLI